MATTLKEVRDYVLENLELLDNITCRSMMGGYLFYYDGILFGGLYDSRFLVKIVDTNKKYQLLEQIPYQGAKMMYLIDTDDKELIRDIVLDTVKSLERKK